MTFGAPLILSKFFNPDTIDLLNGPTTSTLTIDIKNPNNVPETNVALTDNLPAELIIGPGGVLSVGAECGIPPGSITAVPGTSVIEITGAIITAADIPAVDPGLCLIDIEITSNGPDGTYFNAPITATSDSGTSNATDPNISLTVLNAAAALDLTITKTAAPAGPVISGTPVTFTVTITNNDTVNAATVDVTDVLDAASTGSFTITSTTPDVGTTFPLNFVDVVVPAGGSTNLTIAGTVTGTDGQSVTNDATIAETDQTASATVTITDVVTGEPNLTLTKTVAPTSGLSGTPAVFTVTVANTGDADATGVQITDAFTGTGTCSPAPTPTASAGSVSGTFPNFTWDVGTLVATTGTATLTINCTATGTDTQTVINTATVANAGGDPTPPAPASATFTIGDVVVPGTDLTVTKTVDNPAPAAGETITFTVTVTNNGVAPVTSFTLTDTLNGTAVLGSPIYTPSTGSFAGNTWTFVGSLAPGASATLTVSGVATGADGQTINNVATLTGSIPADSNTGDNQAVATAQINGVLPVPALEITKDFTPGGVGDTPENINSGETSVLTINLTNTGTGALTINSFTDALAPLEVIGPVNVAGCTGTVNVAGQTITGTNLVLNPGFSCSIQATVQTELADNGQCFTNNGAQITVTTTPALTPTIVGDTLCVNAIPLTDPLVAKSFDQAFIYTEDSTVTPNVALATVTISNPNLVPLTDVLFTDTLPPGPAFRDPANGWPDRVRHGYGSPLG
ncbi:DUF11 domain-containing protein [bacterium]|nr:DUF11 domain-containing protein [bacterium]